jgi:hypothetical protein
MTRSAAILALALTAAVAVPAHAARRWTPPAPVPGSSGTGYPYDVAVAPDGTAAVAFVRDGIRVAIRLPDGRWSRATKVSTGSKAVTGPDVAIDRAGEVLVAWTESRVTGSAPIGRNSVRVAIRAANGRWRAPKTVGSTEHFIDAELRLKTNGRSDAVLGWRGVSARGHDLLQTVFRPARGAFGRPHSVGEAGFDLQLALTRRGVAYAVWTHLSPPSYVKSSVRFAVHRRTWSRPATVAAGDVGGPQLAPAPARHVLIAWREAEQGLGATRTGLAAVTERSADGSFAPPRVLADNRTPGPLVAVGPTGERLVVWADAATLGEEPAPAALSWTVDPGNGTFGSVQRRLGVGQGSLAMLRDGTAIVVWGVDTIQAVVRPPGGGFGAPQVLARHGQFPVIAPGTRSAVAVWLSGGRLIASRRQARG